MSVKSAFSLQSVAWGTGLQAIRESERFESFEAFAEYLKQGTRLNSEITRARYANLLVKRLFPEKSLDGLNPRTWRTYHDESLLIELARFTTLEAEPVIAQFVAQQLLPMPPGTTLEAAAVRDYISATYGNFKRDSYERLRAALQHMGLVTRVKKELIVREIPRPTNSFLLLVHARLAPTPRIVRVDNLLATPENAVAPFWKLLGIRTEKTVREILRDAETVGLIANYATVDQLEQITTRYSYDDYLNQKLRI
ncbi:hypothetical protein FBQ82_02190 [Anaerolineae bacterium CFX7]|nr:hypothetical protein [Anaerolineae bacterium CFX7]